MAKFRVSSSDSSVPGSPAALFRDLRRDPSVKYLWAHQERILNDYSAKHLDDRNVALELPTGAGKTLVAMLIAEYRRRSKHEKVIFCCPTKQLAAQVAGQSIKYGIRAVLLIGEQKNYAPDAFLKYQQAKAVAITTYSGLFNTNPRLSDPETIICDDAHAAEGYISSMWTVTLKRGDETGAFEALLEQLRGCLPESIAYSTRPDVVDKFQQHFVDLASCIAIADRLPDIRDGLTDKLAMSKQRWAWDSIKDHLEACSFYFSRDIAEIRPIIPPTEVHRPFADAVQRLYMSATLGEDGDIERIFGLKRIKRLPIPAGWDKQGTGRRLMLFPGLGAKGTNEWNAIKKIMRSAKRVLVLVPDDRKRAAAETALRDAYQVIGAPDIEQDLSVFSEAKRSTALIVANRYEGLDLPGDACRMLVVWGLPTGAGLQEKFVMSRLGATTQLRDRIRTRVTQALGRCTRDETDYSAVLLLGEDLVKWCCTRSNAIGMHPELQGELDFGLENSTDRTAGDLAELVQLLMDQGEEWDSADEDIRKRRDAKSKQRDAVATALSAVVMSEVDYVYRLWNGEYEGALDCARRVTDGLEGGKDLRPYRALWFHLAAVAAFLAWRETKAAKFRTMTAEMLERSSTMSLGISWLGRLRAKMISDTKEEEPVLPMAAWIGHIDEVLMEWGLRGSGFAKRTGELRAGIAGKESRPFELALYELGRALGAFAHRWEEKGAPDGLWVFGDWQAIVFEAKTDSKSDALSLNDVRQTLTHERRARSDGLIPDYVPCVTVVIGSSAKVDALAAPHVGDICFCSQSDVVKVCERAMDAIERARALAGVESLSEVCDEVKDEYGQRRVFMSDIVELMKGRKLGGERATKG